MIWRDSRLGGVTRWRYGKPKDADVRIPDELLDTVVFLAVRNDESEPPEFGGTGVLVSIDSEVIPGKIFKFLVTAGHCVKEMEQYGYCYARLNLADGRAAFVDISDAAWTCAADYPATDLAFVPFTPDENWKTRTMPSEGFATEDVIMDRRIGVGDELFVIGLFTKRTGMGRNIPIVRNGIIAAMPEEPIPDPKTGISFHAYLAEIRSIDGLSGSPVFVDIGPGRVVRTEEGKGLVQPPTTREFYLLGLIRGHWPKEKEWLSDAYDAHERELLNTGIATVTPISDLRSMIEERWRADMDETERKYLEDNAPVDDSALTSESEFDRFEDLTRELVNTPKPDKDKEAASG